MSLVPSSELELHSSIGSHTPHAPPEPVPEMTNVPSITGLIVELTFSKFVPIKNIIFFDYQKRNYNYSKKTNQLTVTAQLSDPNYWNNLI